MLLGAAAVSGRVQAAGGSDAPLFTDDAIVMIHDRSLGIPRNISVIADNALITGYATGERPVNSR